MLRILGLLSTAAATIIAAFIGLVLYYPAPISGGTQQAKIGPQYVPGKPIAARSSRTSLASKAPAAPVRTVAESPARTQAAETQAPKTQAPETPALANLETGAIAPEAAREDVSFGQANVDSEQVRKANVVATPPRHALRRET